MTRHTDPTHHAIEFRSRLRTLPAPRSSSAVYTAAFVVSLWGVMSILGAESQPIFISGFLIVGGAVAAVVWTRWVSRRTSR